MTATEQLSKSLLDIDAAEVSAELEKGIRDVVFRKLRRKGVVIGLSGGIDSTVTAALCVRALGKDRVFGIAMPEGESSDESGRLAKLLADSLGIEMVVENIGPTLEALQCYRRRDDAIRKVIPEYSAGWKSKIVLPGISDGSSYQIFSLIAESPSGERRKVRLTPEAYLGVVAATNFKQRTRKMIEYYHADHLWYAVAGTPNRLEYALGFFVKNGDGSADFKPLAHLYKTQVYELARFLDVPEEIRRRPPTTDTYSLEQSQEEFFFSLPLELMDLCLYGKNHGLPAEEIAPAAKLSTEEVHRTYLAIDSKLTGTLYLHLKPQLLGPVDEVKA